eukprot:SAG31_NODE_2021_length_6647_cov_2.271839_10_plen_80_part_00
MTLTAGTNIHVYMGGADSDSSAVEVLTVTDALLPLAKVQSGERFAIGTEWDGDTGSVRVPLLTRMINWDQLGSIGVNWG